ncbi:hypothetical protein BKA69DRAFT_1125879 [Paraphysoderma sedebokerense]|nr:hypothetical protein BKA69DRAFT_1125879 [Paraphysoderma sedebokerense]
MTSGITLLATFAAITLGLLNTVNAHGRLIDPKGFNAKDIRFNDANLCGIGVNVQAVAAKSTPLSVQAGSKVQMTWVISNGDGAGPLDAAISTNIQNPKFAIDVPIVQNVEGNAGRLRPGQKKGNAKFLVSIPQNVQGLALFQVKQPFGFVSCTLLNVQSSAAGSNPLQDSKKQVVDTKKAQSPLNNSVPGDQKKATGQQTGNNNLNNPGAAAPKQLSAKDVQTALTLIVNGVAQLGTILNAVLPAQ